MGPRALLAIGEGAPSDIADMAVDVATEIARRTGMGITVSMSQGGRLDPGVDIASQHLVHIIGGTTPAIQGLGRASVPLVVTPTAHPRRRLALHRRRPPDATWWLVYGRSAAGRIVAEGVALSSRVLPLPMLPYLAIPLCEWPARRAISREALGVMPGSRVVVGIGRTADRSFDVFRQAMSCFSRHEVIPLWIATDAARVAVAASSFDDVPVVSETVGRGLLAAMDVLVETGTPYASQSPAVNAAAAGIPIVTTPWDAAADFVDLGAGGSLLTSTRPAELAAAVANTWRGTARRRSCAVASAGAVDRDDLVALTERCYSDAIGRPLSATTTLLKGRPT